MNSLEQAWEWYQSTRTLLRLVRRLGDRHWGSLPWEGPLGRDPQLDFEGRELVIHADISLPPLDDLAVLVLFSVFETLVRRRVLSEVDRESTTLRHPALQWAAREMREGIAEGSFFRVLEPFKQVDGNLVEEVNQVRRYRNWVAHGRRDNAPPSVDPSTAYDRLQRFLRAIDPDQTPAVPETWVI